HAAALCSRPDCPAQQTSGGFEKSRQCHSYRSEPERSGAASVQLRAVRTAAPRLSIEQAAILLGTERLRTLVLTCSVMQFAGKYLPKDQLMGFWQHSFLSALLSERIARQVDYFEKEQAYLGGLLHDIGQLPMWMLVAEEAAKGREGPRAGW